MAAYLTQWKRDRVDYGTCLESKRGLTPTAGSNPAASANFMDEEEALRIVEFQTKRFEKKMRGIVELDEATRNDSEALAELLESANGNDKPGRKGGKEKHGSQFQSALDLLRSKGKYKKKNKKNE